MQVLWERAVLVAHMVNLFGPLPRGAILVLSLVAPLMLVTAGTAIAGPKCNAWPTDAQTLYTPGEKPSTAVKSASPLVLGHKMAFTVTGNINAVRYYKSSKDTGAGLRYARVYNWPEGELLATTAGLDATFCKEGWVSMPLIAPLRVVKDQIYIVAIDSLQTYVRSSDFLFTDKSRGGVVLLHDGAVYSRRTDSAPAESKGITPSTSYWIDGEWQGSNQHARSTLTKQCLLKPHASEANVHGAMTGCQWISFPSERRGSSVACGPTATPSTLSSSRSTGLTPIKSVTGRLSS